MVRKLTFPVKNQMDLLHRYTSVWFNKAYNETAINFLMNILEVPEDEEEGKHDGIPKHDVVANDEDVIDNTPADCFPEPCYQKFPFLAGDDDSPFWQGWGMLRLKTFRLIENTYFETAVITMILLSSLALVCTYNCQPVH